MKALFEIIDVTKKNLKNYNYDAVFAIVGGEGIGKSNLMLHLIEYYDPLIKIDKIGLNTKDFVKALKNSNKYGAVAFDEAGDGLYSRDAMSGFNKLLNKLYMTIRGNNNLTFLVLPNFFDLDTYFRRNRIKGLFEVYARGKVKFFNKTQIDIINFKCEKFKKIYGIKPSIYDTFPKYKGNLKKEYDKLKECKIKQAMDSLDFDSNLKISKKELTDYLIINKTKLTSKDISYIANCTPAFVSQRKKELERNV